MIRLVDPIVHRSISLVRRQGETLTPAAMVLHTLLKKKLSSGHAAGPAAEVTQAARQGPAEPG